MSELCELNNNNAPAQGGNVVALPDQALDKTQAGPRLKDSLILQQAQPWTLDPVTININSNVEESTMYLFLLLV